MSVRVEGLISIDVGDYSDEISIQADCDDIVDIMEYNNITAGEMIDYLRDGDYALNTEQVYDWLELSDTFVLCAVSKKCIDLLRAEYAEAEDGRRVYMNKVTELEQEQKGLREATPMHN